MFSSDGHVVLKIKVWMVSHYRAKCKGLLGSLVKRFYNKPSVSHWRGSDSIKYTYHNC